jgi:hypothetical protein
MVGTLTCMQWVIYDSFKVYCGLATTGGKWDVNLLFYKYFKIW